MLKKITLFSSSKLGVASEGRYVNILAYQSKEKVWVVDKSDESAASLALLALNDALTQVQVPCSIEVITDSKYLVKSIQQWLERWRSRDFDQVLHVELWQIYLERSAPHDMEIRWLDPLKDQAVYARLQSKYT